MFYFITIAYKNINSVISHIAFHLNITFENDYCKLNQPTMNTTEITWDAETKSNLLSTLEQRFEKNTKRHPNTQWDKVVQKLNKQEHKLKSLMAMELTGGEPDVVELHTEGNAIIFIDCVAESPKGRRSICYDQQALDSRKEHKPANSAIAMAAAMGVTLLNEMEYRALQEKGIFDIKTSSWILTPASIRDLGGALFCDRRYNTVFTYHNGAESYYAARAFRGKLVL
jgi:hypothetical protein